MKKYTFYGLDNFGNKTYPMQFKWEDPDCPPCVGMLDFYWTPDIKFARTWDNPEDVETIAIEFYKTVIVEIDENGESKVIKELE